MLKVGLLALTLTISIVCAFATDVSIYDIQHTTDSTGASVYKDSLVSTGGFVTAVTYIGSAYNYYFISDRSGGLWHGILVNDNENRQLTVGDSVHLICEVNESGGQTRLRNARLGSAKFDDSVMIAPTLITCSQLAEPAEGVLVELHNVIVTDSTASGFTISDSTGTGKVGNGWTFTFPHLGDTLTMVRGLVSSTSNVFTVNPRGEGDIVFSSNRAPIIANIHNVPQAPLTMQPDTITALITDETVVADARIYYRFESAGDFIPVSMFDDGLHGDGDAGDDVWGGVVPAGPARSTCRYYLWAVDDSGKFSTNPPNAPTSTLSYQVSPTLMDIYEHYESYQDSLVTLVGVVNFVQDVTTTSGSRRISAFMQDESGRGINLSQSGAASQFPKVRRGNKISIRGRITTYAGAIQMGEFSDATTDVLASPAPLPEPIALATGDRRLQRQIIHSSVPGAYSSGTWCKVTGTIYRVDENVGGGTNVAIDDGTGSTTIRIWDSMNIDSVMLDSVWYPMRKIVGKYISICGPSSTYNGDFQMLGGGDVSDFAVPQTGQAAQDLTLDLPNRPFAPDLGQKLRISYSAPAMGQVRVRIFDLRGRLVATLVDKPAGGPNVIEWDGRNDLNELLPLGTYILHLESVQSGNSHTKVKPLVIGTKL